MAYKVRILQSAKEDLDNILDRLLSFGIQPASQFANEYEKQLDLLGSGIIDYGMSRMPELAARGYHACLFNSYVMLYYRENDEVVIAHIFHQMQDYARLVLLRQNNE